MGFFSTEKTRLSAI